MPDRTLQEQDYTLVYRKRPCVRARRMLQWFRCRRRVGTGVVLTKGPTGLDLLTTCDVADALGVHRQTAWRWAEHGGGPVVAVGRLGPRGVFVFNRADVALAAAERRDAVET